MEHLGEIHKQLSIEDIGEDLEIDKVPEEVPTPEAQSKFTLEIKTAPESNEVQIQKIKDRLKFLDSEIGNLSEKLQNNQFVEGLLIKYKNEKIDLEKQLKTLEK